MNYHNWSWSFVVGDSCHEQSRIYYYLVISIHEQTCLCILLNTTFIHSWTFMDMLLYVKIIFIHECSDCEWLQSLYIKHCTHSWKKSKLFHLLHVIGCECSQSMQSGQRERKWKWQVKGQRFRASCLHATPNLITCPSYPQMPHPISWRISLIAAWFSFYFPACLHLWQLSQKVSITLAAELLSLHVPPLWDWCISLQRSTGTQLLLPDSDSLGV